MRSIETNNRRHGSLKFLWLATLVLISAAAFRLVLLHDVPPGLSQDEVLNADIVTFIREGRHALFFREGYGHEPLYHYWSTPFQILFGDNVLSIRLPAVFLGLLLVAATVSWVRREYGRIVALVAGLGLAISWWPIVFSRIGIRPIMEPLLLVLAAWHWPRRPWAAGVLLGLSIYSYTAARFNFLLPALLIILLLIVRLIRRPTGSTVGYHPGIRAAVIFLVVSAIFYVPLALTLRADPTLQERIRQLEGPLLALRQGDVKPVLESSMATLGVFALRGDPRWTYTIPDRPLFDPLSAALFLVGLLLAVSRVRQPKYAFVLIWLALTLLPSALAPQAPSIIRLIGCIPIIYLLPGLALERLWRLVNAKQSPPRVGGSTVVVFWLLAILVLAINLARTVGDGFIRWPSEFETRLKYQSVLLDMGRYWKQHPASTLTISTGFFEPITADSFRRNLAAGVDARWVQTGVGVAGAIVFPLATDEALASRLYVPEFAPIPPDLIARAGIETRPLFRSDVQPSFAVYSLPALPPAPANGASITFADSLTFLGYEMFPVQEPDSLRLFTFWRVDASLPWDLAIFVHLLGADGGIAAQHDGLDAAAITLKPGDIILQVHKLPLEGLALDVPYELQVGLYTRTDGLRLNHPGEPADRIPLVDQLFLTENE